MSLPSLDTFFRNKETGMLKEILGFIVDNGSSEAPSVTYRYKHKIHIDTSITKQNVNTILEPLECNIAQQEEKARAKIDKLEKESRKPNTKHSRPNKTNKCIPSSNNENIRRSKRKQKSCTKPQNEIFTTSTIANYVGEKVEVLWNINDLEGTDWQPGWYLGEI